MKGGKGEGGEASLYVPLSRITDHNIQMTRDFFVGLPAQ